MPVKHSVPSVINNKAKATFRILQRKKKQVIFSKEKTLNVYVCSQITGMDSVLVPEPNFELVVPYLSESTS